MAIRTDRVTAIPMAAPSRAKHVVEDFVGGFRPESWVSDRYGGQMGVARREYQVCLAHPLKIHHSPHWKGDARAFFSEAGTRRVAKIRQYKEIEPLQSPPKLKAL
jgi:hypothetical protein